MGIRRFACQAARFWVSRDPSVDAGWGEVVSKGRWMGCVGLVGHPAGTHVKFKMAACKVAPSFRSETGLNFGDSELWAGLGSAGRGIREITQVTGTPRSWSWPNGKCKWLSR